MITEKNVKLKKFSGYILLNMKSGGMRVAKRPRTAKSIGSEVVVKFTLNVYSPEVSMPEITGNITLPETKLADLLFDELEEGGK